MGIAFASANATARLTAGNAVFPGARNFTISVTNNETAGVAGVGAGKTINLVQLNLPLTAAGITLPAGTIAPSGGFTAVQALRSGGAHALRYTGGTLAPGATTTFTFPGSVARPLSSDRASQFGVQVSSNGGSTS